MIRLPWPRGHFKPRTKTLRDYVKNVDAPQWMLNQQGIIARFLPSMDVSEGKLHFITCTGIGDTAWVWAKMWKIAEHHDVTWWFPEAGPYNRIEPYCKLMGMKFGGCVDFPTNELLEYPGEFEEGDFDDGGVFMIHANRHIESGFPLHRGAPDCRGKDDPRCHEWMPWLPFRNPAPPVRVLRPGERPPHTGVNEGVWAYPEGYGPKYAIVHMASETYCEGNHFARHWADLVKYIEDRYAPVKLIGAKWDEKMINDVCKFHTPKMPPCIGQTLATAMTAIANCSALIGVDSGLSIMATYYGKPALRAYPRWLALMPGTFEDPATLHPFNRWCFMDELMERAYPWVDGISVQ